MSDETCDHHWHHLGTKYPNGPYGRRVKTRRCCHCSEQETETIEPRPMFNDHGGDESDCGPFKPTTLTWW